jgi:hypothetical protein
MTIMIPTIHLNGTSRDELHEGYRTALFALDAAINAVSATAPNGRDFYPQGPDAINAATREHLKRMNELQAMRNDLETLALATMPK